MRQRRTILAIVMGTVILFPLIGNTKFHSFSFDIVDYGFVDDNTWSYDYIAAVTYRQAEIFDGIGFYRAAEVSLGLPVAQRVVNNATEGSYTTWTENTLYASFYAPFGFWNRYIGSPTGFYIGGGPAVRWIHNKGVGGMGSFGLGGEIGWDIGKDPDKPGFHLGVRFGFEPLVFDDKFIVHKDLSAIHTSVMFGVFWRRDKPSR